MTDNYDVCECGNCRGSCLNRAKQAGQSTTNPNVAEAIQTAFEKGKQAGQSTKCKCMAGDTSEMRCMCWTAGHEAGQIAAGDLCAKNLCGGFQRGREEYQKMFLDGKWQCEKVETHFVWQVVCYDCNKEKIAALEERLKTERQAGRDEALKVATEECQKTTASLRHSCLGYEQTIAALSEENAHLRECLTGNKVLCIATEEQVKAYQKLEKENARLRDALKTITCFDLGYGHVADAVEIAKKALECQEPMHNHHDGCPDNKCPNKMKALEAKP